MKKMLSLKKRFPQSRRYQNFSVANIQAGLDKLKEIGALNEKRSLKNMAEYSLSGAYGQRRLKLKMIRRGYPKNLVEEVLAEFKEQNIPHDLDKIIKIAKLKKKNMEEKFRSDHKKLRTIRQRLIQFLANRGFDYEVINKILEKI